MAVDGTGRPKNEPTYCQKKQWFPHLKKIHNIIQARFHSIRLFLKKAVGRSSFMVIITCMLLLADHSQVMVTVVQFRPFSSVRTTENATRGGAKPAPAAGAAPATLPAPPAMRRRRNGREVRAAVARNDQP